MFKSTGGRRLALAFCLATALMGAPSALAQINGPIIGSNCSASANANSTSNVQDSNIRFRDVAANGPVGVASAQSIATSNNRVGRDSCNTNIGSNNTVNAPTTVNNQVNAPVTVNAPVVINGPLV